jgi:choline kinase
MKAIILSAGQGTRLLPLTARSPKCTVSLQGRALIEWQIDQLSACGVEDVVVVTGFGAAHVEEVLRRRTDGARWTTVYNPFFEVADNLASCWMARHEMTDAFFLLNGDTVFEPAVVQRLLDSPANPVTLATDHKAHYDDDDMKVQLAGRRLLRVGKDLPSDLVDGESIGLMLFRGEGPGLFREALDQAIRNPGGLKQWYLSVIGQMAQAGHVWTQSIEGLDWAEVDYPLDLARAAKMVGQWGSPVEDRASGETVEPVLFG